MLAVLRLYKFLPMLSLIAVGAVFAAMWHDWRTADARLDAARAELTQRDRALVDATEALTRAELRHAAELQALSADAAAVEARRLRFDAALDSLDGHADAPVAPVLDQALEAFR